MLLLHDPTELVLDDDNGLGCLALQLLLLVQVLLVPLHRLQLDLGLQLPEVGFRVLSKDPHLGLLLPLLLLDLGQRHLRDLGRLALLLRGPLRCLQLPFLGLRDESIETVHVGGQLMVDGRVGDRFSLAIHGGGVAEYLLEGASELEVFWPEVDLLLTAQLEAAALLAAFAGTLRHGPLELVLGVMAQTRLHLADDRVSGERIQELALPEEALEEGRLHQGCRGLALSVFARLRGGKLRGIESQVG